jgi:hypothetical protein
MQSHAILAANDGKQLVHPSEPMIREAGNPFEGRVDFCIDTGLCVTIFLAQLAGREPEVASSHERPGLAATFHMFC